MSTFSARFGPSDSFQLVGDEFTRQEPAESFYLSNTGCQDLHSGYEMFFKTSSSPSIYTFRSSLYRGIRTLHGVFQGWVALLDNYRR